MFDSEFFTNNRNNLKEAFGGTAPIVLAGNSLIQQSSDGAYPFYQDSNFWYLTGLENPGLILVIEQEKEYLILPKGSKARDIFEGEIDIDAIKKISGIQQILNLDEGWKILGRRLSKVKHAATIQPSPAYVSEMIMFTNPSRKQLVIDIKKENPDISLIDLRPFFTSLRSIKQLPEIEAIELAINLTSKILKLPKNYGKTQSMSTK